MIKLTIRATFDQVYELIDNRLPLFMSSKEIRSTREGATMMGIMLRNNPGVQNVDDTVYYFEKQPHRGSVLIVADSQSKKKVKVTRHGMALRQAKGDLIELYMDTYPRAISRGILRKPEPAFGRKLAIVGLIVFAGFLLLAMMTLVVPFILAAIVAVICYPFHYLHLRNEFRKEQQTMQTILSLFESEFSVVAKDDTKDWITFFMRVKHAAGDILVPSLQ